MPAPTCDALAPFVAGQPLQLCGKVAVRRYVTLGGQWSHVCLAHGKSLEKYSELIYAGEDDGPLSHTPTENGE